jgi:hypothetical protein
MSTVEPNGQAHNNRWQEVSATIAPNENYVGARLQFRGPGDVEHAMADTMDQVTVRQILRRVLFSGLFIVPIFVIIAANVSQSDSTDYSGYGSGSDSSGSGGVIALLVIGLLVWLAFALLMPMKETLSEWNLVVDDRADLSESAYATVAEELLRRQVPAKVQPRRMRVRRPQPGIRNFLLVRLGKYFMFVSVFAFGRDLYLGWSLIRRDIPILFLLRYFAAKLGTDPGYSSLIDIEPVKALREVVHNAFRTGIEAAAVGRQISIDSVFNGPIPIEESIAPAGPAASLPSR